LRQLDNPDIDALLARIDSLELDRITNALTRVTPRLTA
jgi:hypothetical protein